MKTIALNERGSVLLVSLLILLVLSLIGIQALNTTDIELAITTNDITYKEALNAAEGGNYVAVKVVSQALNESSSPTLDVLSTLDYIANDGSIDSNPPDPDTFYRELIGVDNYETGADLTFPVSPTANTSVDVQRLQVVNMAGGGAEFSSSYSGVGTSGPKGAIYGVRTTATAPNNATSQVYVQYMKALGVAGGL